jgi:hypothetical protein
MPSSSSKRLIGKGADEDRRNRNPQLRRSRLAASAAMMRCMVGTAVYQVGAVASSHGKKAFGRKAGGQVVEPPAASGARSPPISP